MITLYRRGRIYWARGTLRGKRIQISLDTQFKETAYQRMIDLELHGARRAVKWKDFESEFLRWVEPHIKLGTSKKYGFVVARFSKFMAKRGLTLVHEVEPNTLAAYAADRRQDKHPRTGANLGTEGLKSDLRILHRVFSYAVECAYLEKNPVISPGLNTSGGKTLPFTQKEIDALLSSPYVTARVARHALVLAFLYTGLRISDISALEKKAVNFDAGVILLKTKKRGKDVSLPLHAELRAALKDHLRALNDAQRFSPYVFPTVTGRRCWSQSLDGVLRRIFDKCAIERGHAHRFRDTYAVRLLEHGASLYDVSKLMGITMRVAEEHYSPYVKELQERGRRLVEKLDFADRSGQLGYTDRASH